MESGFKYSTCTDSPYSMVVRPRMFTSYVHEKLSLYQALDSATASK